MAAIPSPSETPLLARWRINMMLVLCLLFALANGVKLFKVQILQHDQLKTEASSEFLASQQIHAKRGVIYDSDGGILAMNVDRDILAATPKIIAPQRIDTLALVLAPLVGKEPSEIKQALSDSSKEYVVLGRRLTPEASEQVRKLEEPGLLLQPEPMRVYPQGSFAASIVGVANHEQVGISGVEGYYNALLGGIPGFLKAEVDPGSNPIWLNPPQIEDARNGADVTLTINPSIQQIVEEELRNGIAKHSASGGTVIVMDPQTGAVLGMASWPTFDPNRYTEYPETVYNKNPAITDQYEPGSTFKVINLAIGLHNKAFTPETVVDDPGSIARAPGCCANWDGNGHSPMHPANVLSFSSNVGALQFAEMAGEEAFYNGIRDFGYGQPTGIELGGEEAGMVQWPDTTEDWRPIVLSTNGYGQGIAVTPLQHLRAIAAIANGGKVMQPYIVQEWCEADECHKTEPKLLNQAVDPSVTQQIIPMMVRAANNNYAFAPGMWYETCSHYFDGAGMNSGVALVPGYNIAAKTGTSSIPDGKGGYENATIGSVVGFGPTENPQFAVLVKLDRPSDIWGVSAIPLYAKIVQRLLTHYHIPPNPALIDECQR